MLCPSLGGWACRCPGEHIDQGLPTGEDGDESEIRVVTIRRLIAGDSRERTMWMKSATTRTARRAGPIAAAALLLAVGLAGCGAEPEASAPTAEPEGDSSPVAAAEKQGPTTEQWASLVAERKHQIDEVQQSWDDANCSASVIDTGVEPICDAILVTMSYAAGTTTTVLGGAVNPESDTYLGEPPAEIDALYFDTFDAADAVYVAYDDWSEWEAATPLDITWAWEDLRQQFAAWSPYL